MILHTPVLMNEVIRYLNPQKNQNFIDATLGLGGYAEKILASTGPKGLLLGIDWDEDNLGRAVKNLERYRKRLTVVRDNFVNIREIVEKTKFSKIGGIVFDLGLASTQLENANYGLSFQGDQILDMRLNLQAGLSASDIINRYSPKELANIFYQYADLKNSRNIARKIVFAREKEKIIYNWQLKKAIETDNPRILAPIFQALRIEVNKELENLEKVLPIAIDLLEGKGRIVVISYHSGEDRIVKNIFRDLAKQGKIKILTKKPLVPTFEEIRSNSRSRSAKLRAAERIK